MWSYLAWKCTIFINRKLETLLLAQCTTLHSISGLGWCLAGPTSGLLGRMTELQGGLHCLLVFLLTVWFSSWPVFCTHGGCRHDQSRAFWPLCWVATNPPDELCSLIKPLIHCTDWRKCGVNISFVGLINNTGFRHEVVLLITNYFIVSKTLRLCFLITLLHKLTDKSCHLWFIKGGGQ